MAKSTRFYEIVSPVCVIPINKACGSMLVGASGVYGELWSFIRVDAARSHFFGPAALNTVGSALRLLGERLSRGDSSTGVVIVPHNEEAIPLGRLDRVLSPHLAHVPVGTLGQTPKSPCAKATFGRHRGQTRMLLAKPHAHMHMHAHHLPMESAAALCDNTKYIQDCRSTSKTHDPKWRLVRKDTLLSTVPETPTHPEGDSTASLGAPCSPRFAAAPPMQ